MIIPTWAKVLILAALIGGIYYSGYNEGKNDCLAKQTSSELNTLKESVAYERGLEAHLRETSTKLQDALVNVREVVQWRERVVTKEVGKPVYGSCSVPESGVAILNANADEYNNLRKTK